MSHSESVGKQLRTFATGDGLRARLLRGGIGSVGVKVLNALVSFALTVVLARVLGPAGYGIYAFAFALTALLAIPAQAGLPHLVVRETAKALSSVDWALMRGLWRWATRYIFIFSIGVIVVVAVVLWFSHESIGQSKSMAILWATFLVPLMALGMVRGAALRGLGRVVAGQLPDSVLRPALLLAMLLVAATWGATDPLMPHQAMIFHVLAAFIAFLIGAAVLWKSCPQGVYQVTHIRQEPVAWRRAALPLALLTGMQVINAQADILILGLLREDAEVGVYRVVVQMSTLVVFGLVALNQVLHPHFARLHAEGDHRMLQRLVTVSARVILGFASLPVLAFIFAGKPIMVGVFGPEYAIGALPLAILALGQLANAAFGSVGALLNMTGHERDTMRGMAIAVVVNLVLNFVLIPFLGMIGAALATAISFAVWNAVLRRFVRLRLGIESMAWSPTLRIKQL